MRNAIRLQCGGEAVANQAKCNEMEQCCLQLPQALGQLNTYAFLFSAPLKWVVGSVAKKRGQGVGRKKDGFRYPKNISIGFVRWDIFSGSGLWHWLFYIMLL
jgi:hypothetical protein